MDIARGFAIDWYSIKINKQVYYVSFTIASGCIVKSQVSNTKDIWTLGLYFNILMDSSRELRPWQNIDFQRVLL